MHTESSELVGTIVKIKKDVEHPHVKNFGGSDFIVEDWWDKLTGESWMNTNGNPACLIYAMRVGMSLKDKKPCDDEVVYGKINGMGHLVHISEIEE